MEHETRIIRCFDRFLKVKGMSLPEYAETVGYENPSYLYLARKGQVPFPIGVLIEIATTLEMNIDYIMGYTTSRHPITRTQIKSNLRAVVDFYGMTIMDVSKLAGISYQSFRAYAAGKIPTFAKVLEMRDNLNVSIDFIYGLTDEPNWNDFEDTLYRLVPGTSGYIELDNIYTGFFLYTADKEHFITATGEEIDLKQIKLKAIKRMAVYDEYMIGVLDRCARGDSEMLEVHYPKAIERMELDPEDDFPPQPEQEELVLEEESDPEPETEEETE